MRTNTAKRLLKVANEAKTLAQARAIAAELFAAHNEMREALKSRDITALSRSIRASQDSIKKLRFVLGVNP